MPDIWETLAAQVAERENSAFGRADSLPTESSDIWSNLAREIEEIERPLSTPVRLTPVREEPTPLPDRPGFGGAVTDLYTAVAGGTKDLIEMGARALRAWDQPGGIDFIRNLTSPVIAETERLEKAYPDIFAQSRQAAEGGLRGAVAGGVRSFIPSAAFAIPGLLAGGVPGMALSAAGVFASSEFDRFMEEAEKQGVARDKALPYAIASAAVEGGMEGIADYLGGKILKLGGAEILPFKNSVKGMLKEYGGKYLTNVLKDMPIEVGTEMIQEGAESWLRRRAGLRAGDPIEQALEVIGPTMVMTALFGAAARPLNAHRRAQIENTLTNADANPEERLAASTYISNSLRQHDEALAEQWDRYATLKIGARESIPIDAPTADVIASAGAAVDPVQIMDAVARGVAALPGSPERQAAAADALEMEQSTPLLNTLLQTISDVANVNVSPYYEAEEARAAREAARGVNVSPYFEDERRRLEAEQGGPVNVSPYFRQERAREIAEQGVNVSPYFEQEGEQRGAEVRRLRALTAPLEGEQPTRVVEPLVGAKVEQEIAAQRAARGERLIEPNTYAAAEAKADEIMRQEAAATETGRLVQRLAGELGENAAPRKTVREMEDEAFRAWAAKAAGHVITDEEAAVTRRILERAEEAESFKGWDALAKRSRAGDLLLTKKSQQKLPLRERQAPTLGEQLGLFTAPATKQSIEAQRGKRLRESKAPAVLPGQMKLGEAKPVELSAAEHAELDALSADDYMSRVKARVPNLRDQKVQVRAVDSSGAAVGADTVPYNAESALRRMSDKIDTLRKLELCLKT